MLSFLQDGMQGEWIMILRVKNKKLLQSLDLDELYVARIISSRPDVPKLPNGLDKCTLWYRVFSNDDCAPVSTRFSQTFRSCTLKGVRDGIKEVPQLILLVKHASLLANTLC